MSRLRVLVVFVVVLGWAAPLRAQDALADAQAALAATTAGWLDELRLGLGYAREQFAFGMNDVMKEMAEDGFDLDQVEVVVDLVDEFQLTVQDSTAEVLEGWAGGVADALALAGPALSPPGSFPVEFSAGAGSAWDAFRATVRARADKSCAAVRKRLANYRKKLAAFGVNLSFQLESPSDLPDFAVNPGDSTGAELLRPGLDFILAWSIAADPDDGRIRLGGHAASAVSLEVLGADAGVIADIAPQPVTQRWRAELGDYDQGQVEGAYVFRIAYTGEPPSDTQQVTLR